MSEKKVYVVVDERKRYFPSTKADTKEKSIQIFTYPALKWEGYTAGGWDCIELTDKMKVSTYA